MGHCETLDAHPIILPQTKFYRASPQTSIFFTTFEHTPFMKHHLLGGPTTPFYSASNTRLSLNPTLIPLVRKPYEPIHIHIYIGMILSTLALSPHGFVFGFFPQNVSYQFDVIRAYILIILPILNRCGTFMRLFCHVLEDHETSKTPDVVTFLFFHM